MGGWEFDRQAWVHWLKHSVDSLYHFGAHREAEAVQQAIVTIDRLRAQLINEGYEPDDGYNAQGRCVFGAGPKPIEGSAICPVTSADAFAPRGLRILEAYEQMLERSHNSSIIALDEERTKFLVFHLVDREHLERFLRRNNVLSPQAKDITRKLTEKS